MKPQVNGSSPEKSRTPQGSYRPITPSPLSAQVDETAGQRLFSRKKPNTPGVLSADNPLPLFGSSRQGVPRGGCVAVEPLPRLRIRGGGRRTLVVTMNLHEHGGASRRLQGTLKLQWPQRAGPRRTRDVRGSTAERGARRRRWGLCALEGSFRRDFVHFRPASVYKVLTKRGPQCTKSPAPRGPVYKVLTKRGPQCTKSGRAHWGRSGGAHAMPRGPASWFRTEISAVISREPTYETCRGTQKEFSSD